MKKHVLFLSILAAAAGLTACGQPTGGKAASAAASSSAASGAAATASAPAGLETEDKQLSYMIGYEIAMQMQLGQLKKAGIEFDKNVLLQAMEEQINGQPSKITPEQAQAVMAAVGKRVEETAQKAAAAASEANGKYLAENKAKEGVQTTASGLQYKINKEGSGAQAAVGDAVSVEYEGRLTDGTVFDSTKEHGGEPFTLPLAEGAVIPGWFEALQLMKEGGEYTIYVPANLAYGPMSPSPKIPANSILVFDMKVTKVEKGGAKKMMQPPAQPAPKK